MPNHDAKRSDDAAQDLAHDIRSELTLALTFLEFIRARAHELPSSMWSDLNGLEESLRLIASLVSEPEDSIYDRVVGSRTVDATTILIRAMRAGRRHTTEAIALRLLRPPSPLPVNVNDVALLRALQNLVMNAIQAIEPAAGVITARCCAVDTFEEIPRVTRERYRLADRPYILIRIEDTGCGMTDERVSRAYHEPFTTKPDGQGRGLGIVRTFLERTGGGLHIESAEDKGSAFSIYLPSADPADAARTSHSGVYTIPPDPTDF